MANRSWLKKKQPEGLNNLKNLNYRIPYNYEVGKCNEGSFKIIFILLSVPLNSTLYDGKVEAKPSLKILSIS